jgi:hypothetical protein
MRHFLKMASSQKLMHQFLPKTGLYTEKNIIMSSNGSRGEYFKSHEYRLNEPIIFAMDG